MTWVPETGPCGNKHEVYPITASCRTNTVILKNFSRTKNRISQKFFPRKNTMNNPIPKSSFFATPSSLEDLDLMIRQLPSDQRSIAYQYTMFAFNLAYSMVEKEKEAAAA